MSQIADATVHSTGGTTRLVDRIEAAGFVQRLQCPNDRRAVHVAITPLGNQKLDVAINAHLAHLEEHLTERLSPDERRELSALLTKLNGEG
jgi:DNA-binding MarR family transcriptional regulator